MAQIAGRRPDKLGNLVRMLELGAVDFDHRVAIAEQNLGGRFDHVSFARSGWAEKEHRSQWTSWIRHPRLEYLIQRRDGANRPILADYASAKTGFKLLRHCALGVWIEGYQFSLLTIAYHFQTLFLRLTLLCVLRGSPG